MPRGKRCGIHVTMIHVTEPRPHVTLVYRGESHPATPDAPMRPTVGGHSQHAWLVHMPVRRLLSWVKTTGRSTRSSRCMDARPTSQPGGHVRGYGGSFSFSAGVPNKKIHAKPCQKKFPTTNSTSWDVLRGATFCGAGRGLWLRPSKSARSPSGIWASYSIWHQDEFECRNGANRDVAGKRKVARDRAGAGKTMAAVA